MQFRDEIPTPALLLDLDAFESNITTMAAHLRARNKGFRPHGKTHKCPEVAKALIRAGAVGICAARLSEAEVFADHGISGLLVTTAVDRQGQDRSRGRARRARAGHDVCVDDERNVRDLDAAAAARRAASRFELAVDLYFGRTGVPPGPPALALVRLIDSLDTSCSRACSRTTATPPTPRRSTRAARAPRDQWRKRDRDEGG